MLEEQFRKQRASLLRDMASQADPFIQRRLLDLAKRYEGPERRGRVTPLTPVDLQIKSPISEAITAKQSRALGDCHAISVCSENAPLFLS
jgi:hypothetical protein